ncbi:trypsin alpha-3 [Drosophila eugracilis]|uniref:trypsin alpha-3 n=1 Tax=Drosophila eugracilis TaxID=29029 RepID=UPI0007E78938|nr:trypsin alpha-3 [Drosophila eugracilis]
MANVVEALQLILLANAIIRGSLLHQGTIVQQKNFGYVLQIYNPKFIAAGSLFSARYILTVAHCFQKSTKPEQLTVRAGHDRIAGQFWGRPVAAFMRHPKFSPETMRNDIAILRVKVAIGYSRYVNFVALCSAPLKGGQDARHAVVGWSLINITQPLKSIDVRLDVGKTCQQFPQLPGGVVCASTTDGEGLCYGDSGDPLISGGEVCGLAIAFRRCGDKRYPALFTDVYYHRPFISQAVLTMDREMLKKQKG